MRIDEVLTNLHAVREVFRPLILSSNYIRQGATITWPNYRPGLSKQVLYVKEYENLVSEAQYSFLLFDKSLLQLYYEFEEGSLKKSKLAYFPFPLKCRESRADLEGYFDATGDDQLARLYLQLLEYEQELGLSNTSHVRIDYDDSATSHAKCHMQLGSINEFRIPARIAVYPFLFVEFLVKNLLADKYTEVVKHRRYQEVLSYSMARCYAVSPFTETNYYLTIDSTD